VIEALPGLFSFSNLRKSVDTSVFQNSMSKPESIKTLFLLRHAKASPTVAGVTDFDRPLHEQGKKAAELIGQLLSSRGVTLDLILSSPAVRARETIEFVMQAAGLTTELRYDQRIYEGGPVQLLEIISDIQDDRHPVMMVGHNPSFEELVQVLTGQAEHLSAGALAKIVFATATWREIQEKKGRLDWVVQPKELVK
jgi:phosphohistidine phosphatase